MIRLIAKLLKVLNSDADPAQISLAFCFAMICGFTPVTSPHNLLILLLVLVFRANISAFILGFLFFSALSFILDPLFHKFGLSLLSATPLQGLWTSLYNSSPWRLERFNNTVVMGSLAFSLILFIPAFLGSKILIIKYRVHVLSWVEKTKLMKMFKASRVFQAYQTVSGWGN